MAELAFAGCLKHGIQWNESREHQRKQESHFNLNGYPSLLLSPVETCCNKALLKKTFAISRHAAAVADEQCCVARQILGIFL